jgi:hypothetical protein
MKYEIITDYTLQGLKDKINTYLAIGWNVTGGLACIEDADGFLWAQAIIWDK